MKVRGGWWRGGKGPTGRRTETQNAQDGSSCPSPRTGLQLGAKDPGEGQRKEKGEEVAAPGRYPAPLVSQLPGFIEPLLTLRSKSQPETPGGAALGCQCLQPAASGIKGFPIF